MKENNLIKEKSFEFSLLTIQVCKDLKINREFELSKQILKCGTSIGANVEEAVGAFSKKDFIFKMTIAYKEARECSYWIKLLIASNHISKNSGNKLLADSQQLERILVSILKTSKRNLKDKS